MNIKHTNPDIQDEEGSFYKQLIKEYNIDINKVYSDFQQKIFNALFETLGECSSKHIMNEYGEKLPSGSWKAKTFGTYNADTLIELKNFKP